MESISSVELILGAGIAGIAAGKRLQDQGKRCVICEKDADWGGLCGYFTIDGFRFDRFVHFSFTPDAALAAHFEDSSPMYAHPPTAYNYWHGYWLKHPAQNNLAPLPTEEKVCIIEDFVRRPQREPSAIARYDEWLRVQYGNYFAEHFPFAYTRKYWGREPRELETRWVGRRLHTPPLAEVLRGSYAEQEANFYYTSHMNYPEKGGFRSMLDADRAGLDIRFCKEVVGIFPREKRVVFADGDSMTYGRLISSLPLPEMVRLVPDCPAEVQQAAARLHCTCGYQVSLGFRRADVARHLWFYIYDEDVPPARVYAPSLKSPDNAPAGCSSLQAEVFYADDACIPPADEVLQQTVARLRPICGFSESDICVCDIRFEPYANVIFTPDIYESRACVREWLVAQGITPIGRFGLWDYLWSHQAYESGMAL